MSTSTTSGRHRRDPAHGYLSAYMSGLPPRPVLSSRAPTDASSVPSSCYGEPVPRPGLGSHPDHPTTPRRLAVPC